MDEVTWRRLRNSAIVGGILGILAFGVVAFLLLHFGIVKLGQDAIDANKPIDTPVVTTPDVSQDIIAQNVNGAATVNKSHKPSKFARRTNS